MRYGCRFGVYTDAVAPGGQSQSVNGIALCRVTGPWMDYVIPDDRPVYGLRYPA